MSGIAGIITLGGRPPKEHLDIMASQISHRGTDDHGILYANGIGLVHSRLATIDLKTGRQPLVQRSRGLALIADAEIYNYKELRSYLIKKGASFDTASDNEVILRGYEGYGSRFISKMEGMFSCALYDKSARELTIAVDRLGIKSVYYTQFQGAMYFASELKALIAVLPKQAELTYSAVAQFFDHQFYSGEETSVKGIYRLLPGQLIRVSHDLKYKIEQYWQLEKTTETGDANDFMLKDRLDSLMKSIMTDYVNADVPYGLYLSGGIDSAILCSMLNRYQTAKIKTYSLVLEGQEHASSSAVDIAQRFKTDHKIIQVSHTKLRDRFVHNCWAGDDLFSDSRNIEMDIVSERVARDIKVLFSSIGITEAFAKNPRYESSQLLQWFKKWGRAENVGYQLKRDVNKDLAKSIFNDQLYEQWELAGKAIVDLWQGLPNDMGHCQKAQYIDIKLRLPDQVFPLANKVAMSHNVEMRMPFSDHRIQEFGLTLSDHLKLHKSPEQQLLNQWAKQYLPKNHGWTTSQDFVYPSEAVFDSNFRKQLKLQLITNKAIGEYFNLDKVREFLKIESPNSSQLRTLIAMTQFAVWHKMLIENKARVKPTTHEDLLQWL